jgi:hypothetical protein
VLLIEMCTCRDEAGRRLEWQHKRSIADSKGEQEGRIARREESAYKKGDSVEEKSLATRSGNHSPDPFKKGESLAGKESI